MRISKTLLIALAFLISPIIYGQANGSTNNKGSQGSGKTITTSISKKSNPVPSSRPKAPSRETIEIVYDEDSQTITFALSETIDYLSVEIENQTTGELHYGNVDATYPVMDVYMTPAPYTITCTSDDGSIYAGDFEVF